MAPDRFDEGSRTRRDQQETHDSEFTIVVQSFFELFHLLEEYAPVWYTEQHHNRAVVAQRLIARAINERKLHRRSDTPSATGQMGGIP
jgi:hypothetical protein